jgi:eukaryotic-like serine/threonine-protein kinase
MTLTPAQWARVAAEFDRVCDAPADLRQAAVLALAATEPEAAAELDALLRASDRSDSPLDTPALHAFAAMHAAAPALLGKRLGAYEVTQVIGRGGMGVVFEGRHTDPQFSKRVAIKTLSIGIERPERLWRFRRERQILATLDHPNIAALYDGGATDDGIPYLVMEFVAGQPIDEWCDTYRLTIAQRIDLFRQVCNAVQFAHSKLIVHRDLKPNNVLVTDDGVVKLLDFGIAKMLTPDDDHDESTRGGIAPLTTAYASPEQVRGEAITTSADVYSLGVMLYRLLTGSAPHDVERRTPAEVREILSTQPPRSPSEAVSDTHAARSGAADTRALSAALRGELDAVVLMALRKEPERRYASVESFSSDLLRYLKGHTVRARPDTVRYRVAKFVRRQRALVAGVTIAVVALLVGTGASLRAAAVARAEARRSQQMVSFLQTVVGAADHTFYGKIQGSADITLREVLDSTTATVATSFPTDARVRADLYTTLGRSFRRFNRYETAIALIDSARFLHAQTTGPSSLQSTEDLLFAAWLMMEVGKIDSATATLRRALAQYERLPDAPAAQVTYANAALGQLLALALHRPAEAIPYLRTALVRERASATPRIQVLAIAEGSLGDALIASGSEAAGDSAFARAIAALQTDSVRSGEELAIQLVNWGTSLSRRNRGEESAVIKRRALIQMQRANGPNHKMTAVLQSRLASELVGLSRYAEARGLADSALVVLDRMTPRNIGEVGTALRLRAETEIARGDAAGATRTLLRARALLDSLESGREARTVDLLLLESKVASVRGSLAQALALAVQAQATATQSLPATDTRVVAATKRVAELSSGGR